MSIMPVHSIDNTIIIGLSTSSVVLDAHFWFCQSVGVSSGVCSKTITSGGMATSINPLVHTYLMKTEIG